MIDHQEKDQQLNSKSTFSRRSFLKRTGIGLSGMGLASLFTALASASSDPSGISHQSAAPDLEGVPPSIDSPVVDVHRHCIPEPASMAEGLTRYIGEMRMNYIENELYSSATIDGITSIIYPEMKHIDLQMKEQAESGVTLSMMSFSMGLESMCRALFFLPDSEITTRFNDATAKMIQSYPGKAVFMVSVNPLDESCTAECERCFNAYDAKGITINTSWDGQFPDAEEAEPFWRYAQEKDVPIFIHPPFVPIGHEKMDIYRLEEMIGRPFDTTMAVARMIYSGVFDRYPGLKIVLPHMGAALPNISGRLDFGYRLGYKGLPPEQAAVCLKKPSEYFRTNLYVDTMGFNPLGVRYAVETFGIDNVLFGTDYAAVPISPREHINMIEELGLPREDQNKIFWKNADRIFRLSL